MKKYVKTFQTDMAITLNNLVENISNSKDIKISYIIKDEQLKFKLAKNLKFTSSADNFTIRGNLVISDKNVILEINELDEYLYFIGIFVFSLVFALLASGISTTSLVILLSIFIFLTGVYYFVKVFWTAGKLESRSNLERLIKENI